MVETPPQYRFVAKILQLPDPGICDNYCLLQKSVLIPNNNNYQLFFIIFTGCLLSLLPILFFIKLIG